MSARFEYRPYRLPFRRPMRNAHGLWEIREGVLIRVEKESGEVRYGEAAPVPGFGCGAVDGLLAILEKLKGRIDAESLRTLPEAQPTLRFAFSSALAGPPPPCREYLPVAALLPAGRAALGVLAERLERGFRVFKWKVGVGNAADERVLLDDLLAQLPSGASLRLDANGAWERREAERWFACAAERPIEFIEQPTDPRGRDLLRGLAGDWPTTIALDESLSGDADAQSWLDLGWPGIFVVKPALLADPESTLARFAAARADLVFSSALETAVGAQSALRLALAWTGKPRALGFGVWPLFQNALFDGPAPAPFLYAKAVEALDPATLWRAVGG